MYESLLQELWPNLKYDEGPSMERGLHSVPVTIESRFTQKYYRAIAKIAFRYYLRNTRYGFTGREPTFEPIRRFIMEGGDQASFYNGRKPRVALPVGVLPDGTAVLPARWMHLLVGIESAVSAVVGVYTLFGPQKPPSPHFVNLFQCPSPIYLPEHTYGHAYVYGDRNLGDSIAGLVERVSVDVLT